MQIPTPLIRIVQWTLIAYGIIGIALYYLQDKLVIHPTRLELEDKYSFTYPHKEVNLQYEDNVIFHLVQFTTKDSTPKGVVLYFHGNRENIERYARFAPFFTKEGYEVWMCDYPAFGKSRGEFSEALVYEESIQVYKLARQQFSSDQIIVYGKSLGTGPATYLASKRDCKQLILETPYLSIPDVATHFFWMYPVKQMMQYDFPNKKHILLVDAPITIYHGTNDRVIPYAHAQELYQLQPTRAELVTLPEGTHHNLMKFPLMQDHLRNVLRKQTDIKLESLSLP